jgi:hypothetical protein
MPVRAGRYWRRDMSGMADIVNNVPLRFAASACAYRHALSADTALPLLEPAVQR